MAERFEDEELDFLVRAQLPDDPKSFVEVVKEAFLLEHDCIENQDIAEVLGVTKGRITQIYKDAESLKPHSIRLLLSKLKKASHRRAIVRAWVHLCFAEDITVRQIGERAGSVVTERTVRRVDRHIRQGRYREAAALACETWLRADDIVLKERLLDRAYFTRLYLHHPGHAMQVARRITEGGLERKELQRAAAGLLFRARIIETLADSSPSEIEPVFNAAQHLLLGSGPVPGDAPYVLADAERLRSTRLRCSLTFIERGLEKADERMLRTELSRCLETVRRERGRRQRYGALITAVRIHTILGETFQAEELLDRSYKLGEFRTLNLYELSGLQKARLLLQTDALDEAASYLEKVSDLCEEGEDFYHQRVAEYELARVESNRFPKLL